MAELPPGAVDGLVAGPAALSDRNLFSAAVPGQGGTGHVDEQPHGYWLERFDRLGFGCGDRLRPPAPGGSGLGPRL